MLQGIGISPGIALGKALLYREADMALPPQRRPSTAQEQAAFLQAVEEVKHANRKLAAAAEKKAGEREGAIFQAHIALLEDHTAVIQPIAELIEAGSSAAEAVSLHFGKLSSLMESVSNPHLRSRAGDLQDVQKQLLQSLLHLSGPGFPPLEDGSIVVARQLTPGDVLRMAEAHVKGFVCENGGPSSHMAIIARAVGLPAVAGCPGATQAVRPQEVILLNGHTGQVLLSPSQEEKRLWQAQARPAAPPLSAATRQDDRRDIPFHGRAVGIFANVTCARECKTAFASGCDGIGLFRSEYLYMASQALPDEETQLVAYRETLSHAGGKPVIIRTLDAGADKAIPSLPVPGGPNPALGYRGLGLSLTQPEVFQTQLRALYRASCAGDLRILLPMVRSMEELLSAKELAREARARLAAEGVPHNPDMKIGIMVEVPAVAVMADAFAKEADFFSIGTNDLVQYALAADREEEGMALLYTHYDPALLRLVEATVAAARGNGIPCYACGEAARDPGFLPLLWGMGLDAFSMPPTSAAQARQQMAELSYGQCQEAAQKALLAKTAREVRLIGEQLLPAKP